MYSKAKFACYSRCFLTSYFCIPVPCNGKDILFWVLVLETFVDLHRTIQLQLLQLCWSGHRLGLLWQHIKKQKHFFVTKVCRVKAIVFPVVTFGCESWTVKKAEHWRIDVFELWCWRRLWGFLGLQGDPTSPAYRKSVLNIHWKDWCWIWNSSPLVTWWEELIPWKRPWCWERLKAGGEGDYRESDGWMASPTIWT